MWGYVGVMMNRYSIQWIAVHLQQRIAKQQNHNLDFVCKSNSTNYYSTVKKLIQYHESIN